LIANWIGGIDAQMMLRRPERKNAIDYTSASPPVSMQRLRALQ